MRSDADELADDSVSEEIPSPGAAAAGHDQRSEHGAALAAISRRFVGLLKEYYGKGPTEARTYYWGNLVVVLMGGGYSQAEKTLIEEGRGKAVMDLRSELQEVMRGRFKLVIEEELRREVVAFMSATHHDPELNAELFVLLPPEGENITSQHGEGLAAPAGS
jgi:uncharacterized protein YbcI